MKLIKVAAAVLNQTPLAWEQNKTNILAALKEAREQNVSLVCMPEMCITGYGCEDAFHSPGIQKMALTVLEELLPHTKGMIVSFGLPLLHGGALFNMACLVNDGKLMGFVGKQNLAGDGIHYEPRWFKPWPNNVATTTEINGVEYPIGDLTFGCGGVAIGFEICEDAWVGTRPGAELSQRAVDIILNPSASHFAFGKHEVRKRFVLEGSRAFHVGYIYTNLLGNEAGRAIYDGDAMIANSGRLLAMGPRLSFENHSLTTATLDIDATRMSRARTASFQFTIDEDRENHIRAEFDFPEVEPKEAADDSRSWEKSDDIKEEEFTRSVALGLFDYMRKSYSRGFVVSLSGGADSAAVATLCFLVVRLGIAELGRDVFLQRLSYMSDLSQCETEGDIVKALLSCVYQATRNSSDVTTNAARTLAEALNADFMEFDVDSLVQGYVGIVSGALGRELTWETDDIALQNIQARVRSPSVWMLANIRSALLLSTSNRSEAAVGYATMDGDTSGGLSPIAGIDKAFLRHWLRWMESDGPEETATADGRGISALSGVNVQQPTAELRPQEAKQTDEDDLMPYDLLDAVERLAIRDKLVPLEVLQKVTVNFSQYSLQQAAEWVERFFRLWCRNQWKRERYAPSFHLDDENLDPKTWCRFPILSGGFQRELAEMRAWLSDQ
jgi:NAD+ synthase (glutamine-hydrolysing)